MRTPQERPRTSALKPYSLAAQPSRSFAWREPATIPSSAEAAPVRALDGDAWTEIATHLDPQSVLNLVAAIPTQPTAQALRGVRSAVLSERYGSITATAQDLRHAKHYFPSGATRARDLLAAPVTCPQVVGVCAGYGLLSVSLGALFAPLTVLSCGDAAFLLYSIIENERHAARERKATSEVHNPGRVAAAGVRCSNLSHALRQGVRPRTRAPDAEPTESLEKLASIEHRLNKYLHRALDRGDLGGFVWLLTRGAPLHLPDPASGRYPSQRVRALDRDAVSECEAPPPNLFARALGEAAATRRERARAGERSPG